MPGRYVSWLGTVLADSPAAVDAMCALAVCCAPSTDRATRRDRSRDRAAVRSLKRKALR